MNRLPELYPLKFVPIYKEKIWGGNKLHTILGKNSKEKTGESWEISSVDNTISKVANGNLKDESLKNLIANTIHN